MAAPGRPLSPPPAYNDNAGTRVVDPELYQPFATSPPTFHDSILRDASTVPLPPTPSLRSAHSSPTLPPLPPSPPLSPPQVVITEASNAPSPLTRRVPAEAAPVVMTWSPPIDDIPQTFEATSSRAARPHTVHETTSFAAESASFPSVQRPPTLSPYQPGSSLSARIQSMPEITNEVVTYTFSPLAATSMIVLPPATSTNSRPLYHVSWREDFFLANSLVTTIRRGGSEDGPYVGEFDLRGTKRSAVVRIGATEKWLNDVLLVGSSKSKGVSEWKWSSNPNDTLFFIREGSVTVLDCKLGAVNGMLLARFQPPNYNGRNQGASVAKFEVSSEVALRYINEIFICSLILERIRITNTL